MTFSPEQRDELARGAMELGIALSIDDLHRFSLYSDLLEETNRSLNLTRVSPDQYISRHYLDSLTAAPLLRDRRATEVLDIGAGAGLPSIPLAIALPETRFTILDSTAKKLRFVDAVLAELAIKNAITLHARVEEIGRAPQFRERFDAAVARAVAPLDKLTGWALPLLKAGGILIAYKSKQVDSEIEEAKAAITAACGAIAEVRNETVPMSGIQRKLVVILKTHSDTAAEARRHRKRRVQK